MGKAQSKRSVDITTETKKGPEGGEEVTGKMEKIEDIDQKQVNGDATPQETNDASGGGEKKDAPDETENDKDLTTEKSAVEAAEAATPSPTTNADGSGDQTAPPKEDAAATPVKEGEDISPLADEGSNKKTKKEKTKRKWSFRNLSFGKKDKSKPKSEGAENAPAAANEENAAAAATNGEAAETSQPPAEGEIAEAPKTDEAAAAETKPVEAEKIENGVASETEQKQMNGQKTPTSTDEAAEQKKSLETNESAAATSPPIAPAAANKDTANEKVEAIVSNGTSDAEKNGVAHGVEHTEEKTTATPAAAEESNSKSIPIEEKPHQNGTNGDEAVEEITAATKTLQIEVKTEHPNDINNSTITSTTIITTNSYTTTTNTTTTNTTTIPVDNINTEQKTVDNDDNNILISTTTVHNTDITPPQTTTTNTSDISTYSSNKSIDKCEEQNEPCKVNLNLPNEESPNVIEVEDEIKDITTNKLNDKEEQELPTEEGSHEQQQEQQQQAPPPLPVTAPPSQVAIFALKDENETNSSNIVEEDVIPRTGIETPTSAIEITETVVETTATTASNSDDVNLITITESIEVKSDVEIHEKELSGEIIDMGEVQGMTPEDFCSFAEKQPTATVEDLLVDLLDDFGEDFEAQALNIVDQIEKDLEKEEAADNEKQQYQEEEIEETEFTHQNQQQPQAIDMDICSQNSEENLESTVEQSEALLPPPPPQLLAENEEQDMETNSTDDDENNIIDTINDCVGEAVEITIDSMHHNNHHNNGNDDEITEKNVKNMDKISDDFMNKIDELEEQFDFGLNNMNHNIKEAIVAATATDAITDDNAAQNIVGENFIVGGNTCTTISGDFDDKEMPTAKELKENAAAAEIKTQDLPVTCE